MKTRVLVTFKLCAKKRVLWRRSTEITALRNLAEIAQARFDCKGRTRLTRVEELVLAADKRYMATARGEVSDRITPERKNYIAMHARIPAENVETILDGATPLLFLASVT